MKCIIDYAPDHAFSLSNLPYGCFCTADDASTQRCGVAIGDYILDLQALSLTRYFPRAVPREVFAGSTLNAFMELSKGVWLAMRRSLQELLSTGSPVSLDTRLDETNLVEPTGAQIGRRLFVSRLDASTVMCLPCTIGDYTDFYSSIEHATNCGELIRGKEKALQPNWKHLPVAYHGRSSSIVPSGTAVRRPVGQILPEGESSPVIAPCAKLDFELEIGFFLGGRATALGERVSTVQAADRVFGAVLLNDWSARDVQTWEYVPLGPFLSKNFATTISPWIVPIHALELTSCPGYTHDPPLLPYLQDPDNTNFDIPLTVSIRPDAPNAAFSLVSRSSLRHTYYTIRQMLAHHSTTGCPLRAGDLLGTGTLSAPGTEGYGSLLEKSRLGREAFALEGTNVERRWLEDGDTVKMSGLVRIQNGECVGFGECVGQILPALPL